MAHATDVRTIGAALYFLPVQTRMPLKFGRETVTSVTCARVRITVTDGRGRKADALTGIDVGKGRNRGRQIPHEDAVAFDGQAGGDCE